MKDTRAAHTPRTLLKLGGEGFLSFFLPIGKKSLLSGFSNVSNRTPASRDSESQLRTKTEIKQGTPVSIEKES